MSFYFKLLMLYTCTLLTSADFFNNNYEDRLVLSPAELIDMVLKERVKNNELQSQQQIKTMGLSDRSTKKNDLSVTELNDDENMLKQRKVWSRWGKWGECSVTCGSGTTTRQRVCAGGRCARGELQQQRRHCEQPPCQESHLEPHDTE